MPAERSEYVVSLKDETSGPALKAATALEQLRKKIERDTLVLRQMQAALGRLRGTSQKGTEQFRALQAQIAAQRDAVARSQARFLALGGSFETAAKKGGALEEVWDAIRGAGGPVGSLASRVSSLVNPFVAVFGLATAGAAALVSFAAAAVSAAVALSRFALAAADARRSEMLHLEGLTTLRNVYGVAAGRASDLVAAIDRVSDASALSRGEISGMAESLYRSGLRGANLADALNGLSLAQSVQGDRGAARFRALAVSIARTGGSVRALAQDYQNRLGPIARRQALSLERQSERLRESLGRIFGDVHIEGFLEGLHDVLNLFSQSTSSGRALRTLAGAIFSPLFDSVGRGSPLVVRLIQGMIIGGQRITIVFLRLRHVLAAPFRQLHAEVDPLRTTIAVIDTLGLALLGVAVVVSRLAYTWQALRSQIPDLASLFTRWRSAGVSLIDGFVEGILSGPDRVRSAIAGVASSATDSLRSALGIHSPSRVFAGLGRQIPRGFAEGVDDESGVAARATERMGGDAESGASGPNRRAAGAVSVSVGEVHVHVANDAQAQDITRSIREELSTMLEGVGIELGAA